MALFTRATGLGLSAGVLAKAVLLCFLDGVAPTAENIYLRARREGKERVGRVRGPW